MTTIFRIATGAGFTKTREDISASLAHRTVERATAEATRLFGGCTVFTTQGGFKHADGSIILERGFVLEIVVLHTPTDDDHKEIDDIATFIRTQLNQESVLVTIIEADARFL